MIKIASAKKTKTCERLGRDELLRYVPYEVTILSFKSHRPFDDMDEPLGVVQWGSPG